MKILLGILCLLAAVLVLLLIPIVLSFSYRDGVLKAHIRYMFLRYDLLPRKEQKETAKKPKRESKKKRNKPKGKEEAAAKGTKAIIDMVWSLLKASKWGLNLIRRRLLFYSIRVHILVGSPDAHQTAVKYGKIGSVVYLGEDILKQLLRIREPDIRIAPDYLSETTYCEISFKARLQPIMAATALTHLLVHYIKATQKRENKRKNIKGVRKHESTASGK